MIGYGSLKNFLMWMIVVWLPLFTGWGMYNYGIDLRYCFLNISYYGSLEGRYKK